jgi:molecular chaperone GrpE
LNEEKRTVETPGPTPPETPREIPIDGAAEKGPEAQDLIDRIQRLQAEFENYKKRVMKDTAEREDRATDALLVDMLPLYDALRLAFENHSRDRDADAFLSGVERIFAQFEQILDVKGVQSIDAVGKLFDPALHEALLALPSDEPKNTIVEEFSPGYARGGRTLRPSKVGVSRGPAPAQQEEE